MSAERSPRELLAMRRDAARNWSPVGRTGPPPDSRSVPQGASGLPEVAASGLSAEALGAAISSHGALLVRELLGEEMVDWCISAIERIRTQRLDPDAPSSEWFSPFLAESKPQRASDDVYRTMVWGRGVTWLADSPIAASRVLDGLTGSGAVGVVSRHLGEPPFFSLQKTSLRRTRPDYDASLRPEYRPSCAWHQDGSFLGARAVNIWVALSPCGADLPTPGLEVIPRSFEDILPTRGVVLNSVADEEVERLMADAPSAIPGFAPGDALMFDEKFLHRTHLAPGMTDVRYALECWLFAPSGLATQEYTWFLA